MAETIVENEEPIVYPPLPEYFDVKVARDRFGFSRTMCYELLANPAVGGIQIGNRKFFSRDRLFEWLDAQKIA